MLSIQIAEYRSFRSEIIELWSKCYGRMLDQRLADWFFDGYLKNFIFLAFDENQKMVGMYCLMEQYSNIGGGAKIFLCNNVCADPAYPEKSIFVKLGRYAMNFLATEKAIAYGFPNRFAIPGHKRVGWVFSKPLRIRAAYSREKVLISDQYTINNLSFQENDSSLSNSIMSATGYSFILKDHDYNLWRYSERREIDRNYVGFELSSEQGAAGYMLLSERRDLNRLHILEVCGIDESAVEALIGYAINYACDCGIDCCNILESLFLEEILNKKNFTQIDGLCDVITVSYNPNIPNNFLFEPSDVKFYVSWGDYDVY